MLGRFGSFTVAERPEPAPEDGAAPPVEDQHDMTADVPVYDAAPQSFQRRIVETKVRLHRRLIDEINLSVVEKSSKAELRATVNELVRRFTLEERIAVNASELDLLTDELIDELTGLGPLEPLLQDPTINDILINTHEGVYVERFGVLEPIDVVFRDENHLLRIINKVVSAVGRRVDESQPICDARLADGSRVNVAIRPVAVDGPLVSIRKFSKQGYSLD